MKPFTLYHLHTRSFLKMQEKLVSIILEAASPDRICLLGASLYRRRSESIFNTEAPTSQYISDYFLLILLPAFAGKAAHEWQDQIEQRCAAVVPVTTIVMETGTFLQWYREGHYFPCKICEKAIVFYDAGTWVMPGPPESVTITRENERENIFAKGLCKAHEFLAGAELFLVRKQHAMALFMLHQSAEQALRTLLKVGIGFHINTHNLDRLLRYAALISARIPDIFPRRTDQDKRLFSLLQKAYSDSRYKNDTHITRQELVLVTEKVKALHEILKEVAN